MRKLTEEQLKCKFDKWWESTNHGNYFKRREITLQTLYETAYCSWRAALYRYMPTEPGAPQRSGKDDLAPKSEERGVATKCLLSAVLAFLLAGCGTRLDPIHQNEVNVARYVREHHCPLIKQARSWKKFSYEKATIVERPGFKVYRCSVDTGNADDAVDVVIDDNEVQP